MDSPSTTRRRREAGLGWKSQAGLLPERGGPKEAREAAPGQRVGGRGTGATSSTGTWGPGRSRSQSQTVKTWVLGAETQDSDPPPNCPTRLAARPSPPPWRAVGRRGRPAGRRGAADMPGRAAVQVPPPTSTQRRRFPSRAHGQRGVRPTPAPLYAKARTQRYLKSGFPTGRRRGRARDARGRAHRHRNPPAHRRLCSLPNVTESFSEQVRPTLSRSRKTTRATGLN